MLSTTKILTALVTLAAVLTIGFASAPITQDASAAVNDGRYKRSSEAKRRQMYCDVMQSEYDQEISYVSTMDDWAKLYWDLGRPGEAHEWDQRAQQAAEKAEDIKQDGQKLGCSWAA
jgi:hypothetical protein